MYASYTSKFDERNRKIETAFFGVDGKPCIGEDGCARWEIKYNEFGKRTQVAYYGIDGKPCISQYGYHKATYSFDKDGALKEILSFDEKGDLIEQQFQTVWFTADRMNSYLYRQGVRENNIFLKYNEWTFGQSAEQLMRLIRATPYSPKEIVYLTPEGEVKEISMPGGEMKVQFTTTLVDKAKYQQCLDGYNRWKASRQ